MDLSNQTLVVIPESWDEIQEFINHQEHPAYATVLALMVHNYTLHRFSKMGAYAFSGWKQEYLKNA